MYIVKNEPVIGYVSREGHRRIRAPQPKMGVWGVKFARVLDLRPLIGHRSSREWILHVHMHVHIVRICCIDHCIDKVLNTGSRLGVLLAISGEHVKANAHVTFTK